MRIVRDCIKGESGSLANELKDRYGWHQGWGFELQGSRMMNSPHQDEDARYFINEFSRHTHSKG